MSEMRFSEMPDEVDPGDSHPDLIGIDRFKGQAKEAFVGEAVPSSPQQHTPTFDQYLETLPAGHPHRVLLSEEEGSVSLAMDAVEGYEQYLKSLPIPEL
jgi:hypothetical protein